MKGLCLLLKNRWLCQRESNGKRKNENEQLSSKPKSGIPQVPEMKREFIEMNRPVRKDRVTTNERQVDSPGTCHQQ